MTAAGTPDPVLSISAVTVSYGEAVAVDAISLHVAPGEQVALLGPSGAGKSTILRLAAGAVRPDRGEVEVLGRRWLGSSSDRQLARRVAVIHQHLELVGPLKVIHNVNAGRLGAWSTRQALASLIRPREVTEGRVALGALGLDDRWRERTDRLSGGQQQRVAVARAMRQQAELVLADEPISAVDPAWRRRVLELLLADCTARRATLVASLHDANLAVEYFDRLVGIADGRVAFDLPAAQVNTDVLTRLYGAAV